MINSFNSNAKLGKGNGQFWKLMSQMEALKLPINYSIVTNIDFEHLDFYKKYKNLESLCKIYK